MMFHHEIRTRTDAPAKFLLKNSNRDRSSDHACRRVHYPRRIAARVATCWCCTRRTYYNWVRFGSPELREAHSPSTSPNRI